jgi:hypothetical protein
MGLVLVDDRREGRGPLPEVDRAGEVFGGRLRVVTGRRLGPAAARNTGWHAAGAPWIAFLDDDVVPEVGWAQALRRDLELPSTVAGSQGDVAVPLPAGRRPTDWERNVAGLADAAWITADMAYRRTALSAVGGFDERFRRAYREDADLALRMRRWGGRLVRGRRRIFHPPGSARRLESVHAQAGNADDVLMRAIHGRRWRTEAGVPRGRRRRHVGITATALAALLLASAGRRRAATASAAAWALGTAELAGVRIAPGPRDAAEVARMLATSLLIPPAATFHTLRGVAGV